MRDLKQEEVVKKMQRSTGKTSISANVRVCYLDQNLKMTKTS